MSVEIPSSLISTLFSFGREAALFCVNYFSPPAVEVIDSRTFCGPTKPIADDNRPVLRVCLRYTNEDQQPLWVRSVTVLLDEHPLKGTSFPDSSSPKILSQNGWEIVETKAHVYRGAFQLPAVNATEQFAFFDLPKVLENSSPLDFVVVVMTAKRKPRKVKIRVFPKLS